MGALIGLCVGIGAMLIFLSFTSEPRVTTKKKSRAKSFLAEAGLAKTTPFAVTFTGIVLGALAALTVQILTTTWPLAFVAALTAIAAPWLWVGQRRQALAHLRSQLWPDIIDTVISGVRAGLSLSETLIGVAHEAPPALRQQLAIFEQQLRRTGSFESAIKATREGLADPVADRVCEALRVAHTVGGADVTQVLASLAAMLRRDQRTRGELEARQSWTINGARLAVAAPWIVVLIICTSPSAADAYTSATGALILFGAALISVVAYVLMITLARLPLDKRVFR